MQKQKILIVILLFVLIGGYLYYNSSKVEPTTTLAPTLPSIPKPTVSEEEIQKIADSISAQYTVNPKFIPTDPPKELSAASVEYQVDKALREAGITKAPKPLFNDSTKYILTEAAIRYAYPLYDDKYRIEKDAFETLLNETIAKKESCKSILSSMKNAGIQIPDKATIPFFNCFILFSRTFSNTFVKDDKFDEYDLIGAFFFLNLRSWLKQLDKENLLNQNQVYSVDLKELSIDSQIMYYIARNVVYKNTKNDIFVITTFVQPIFIDNFIIILSRAFANYRVIGSNTITSDISSGKNWSKITDQCRINPELKVFPVVTVTTN